MIGLTLALLMASGPIVESPPPAPRAVPSFNPVTNAELGAIRSDVRKGREEGLLTRRQARELRREAREISMLEERFAAGRLGSGEAAELRARIEVLRALTRGKRLGTVK
jgi:hypothetical protein